MLKENKFYKNMKDTRPYTIFCDIDGVLVKHLSLSELSNEKTILEVLPGVIDTLNDWEKKGYNIILITGRKENMRKATEIQLARAGIIYDKLIMGISGGYRILINDRKDNSLTNTAYAINLNRNEGLLNIENLCDKSL